MDWAADAFANFWPVLFILVGLVGLIWGWIEVEELWGVVLFLFFAGPGVLFFFFDPPQILARYWPALLIILGIGWLWYSIVGKRFGVFSGLLGLLTLGVVGVMFLIYSPNRIWSWAFQSDLTLNLVSEGIGILVTILFVGRLLVWNERRRWREVRGLFLAQADRASQKIISAWGAWLLTVAEEAHSGRLTRTDRTFLLEMGYYALEDEATALLASAYLGRPPGASLEAFAKTCNSKGIDEMIRSLVPYLASKVLPSGHPGWAELYEKMNAPVQKLSDLVDRYSTIVDPEFARSVIRLSIDLDNLESGEYEEALEHDVSNTAVALTIAEGIRQSLELQSYIRDNKG